MNTLLKEKLPSLFDILAEDDPWVLTIDNDDDIPAPSPFLYVLLCKQQSQLQITPNGEVTFFRIVARVVYLQVIPTSGSVSSYTL